MSKASRRVVVVMPTVEEDKRIKEAAKADRDVQPLSQTVEVHGADAGVAWPSEVVQSEATGFAAL